MFKNCLTFAVLYKKRHPDAIIRMELPILIQIMMISFRNTIDGIKLYKTEFGGFINMLYPHFSIEHNGYILEPNRGRISRTKIIKENN